jgi:hypothetical protein
MGYCENGTESFGYIIGCEFIEKLSAYQLHKKNYDI